jgi:hypothetical protein
MTIETNPLQKVKFQNIKQFPNPHYSINVSWIYLKETLYDNFGQAFNIDLNPLFQRGHVWTKNQQIAYVEFILKGGKSGKDIYFNCPDWDAGEGDMSLVDGKQRLTAVFAFLDNKIKIFGYYLSEFEDTLSILTGFNFHINSLDDNGVLEWYISLNSGTPHTDAELNRIRELIKND